VKRVVIVGNGMAGSRLVEDLRRAEAETSGSAEAAGSADISGKSAQPCQITVFGAETVHAYNRILLSHVLAGSARAEDISITSKAWVDRHQITLHRGVTVVAIDRASREVTDDTGARTGYDWLVLATGSQARIPELQNLRNDEGALIDGIAVFRTLDDCDRIVTLAKRAQRAVILGGGLLGLEAARGLAERGLDVIVLHHGSHVMERQLDSDASRTLRRILHKLKVPIATDVEATAVRTDEAGRLTGVELADGGEHAADLLVISCGVRPETALARQSGLAVGQAILVDDELRSVSDEHIFAIGECCEHDGQVYGLVAPAWEQAATVAKVLTGQSSAVGYRGSRLVTRLKAAGVEVAAMGEVHHEPADGFDRSGKPLADEDCAGAIEVIRFADPARNTYHKLVVRNRRLIGAIIVGDTTVVGTLTQLFDRGAEVPSNRESLLFGRRPITHEVDNPTRIPDRATICQCNGVTKGALCASFLDGNRSVRDLADSTRATTGCGGCRDTVSAIVDWLSAAEPAESLTQ
jgi:assimilatory nitrate reductase electron transfer subunit